jgi:hypothetical protein
MFDNLSDINACLISNIEADPHNPVLIYYGVGTAAGLRNADGILEAENYHQFPPFLQNLKNKIPELNIHLVLMDSHQEHPIYMEKDMGLTEITEDLYVSERVTVYVLRKDVYTQETTDPEALNITHDLVCMNAYAMINNITLIYHNFTGRSNEKIAELFDQELGEHLDHIVYGFGNRQDLGCYFNLNEMDLPYRVIEPPGSRPMVKFYNIYKYIILKDYTRLLNAAKKYNVHMQELIQTQTVQVKTHILSEFRNHLFHNMRMLKEDDDKKKLKVYCGKKIDILCRLKSLSYTGLELLDRIITEEPNGYLWYNHLVKALE